MQYIQFMVTVYVMASSKIDLEILKRISRDRLIRILEEAPGPKDLVIDKDLMKMLDRISDAKILRNHGVNKMFHLERIPPAVSTSQLVYLMKPSLFNIKYVADHLQELKTQVNLLVHVICCPRIVSLVNTFLEEEGLYGSVVLHEFIPEFIALDEDLLSLEMHSFFKDVFVDGDFSECLSIAHSLNTIQNLFGSYENIFGHGRAAQVVLKMLENLRSEQPAEKIKDNEVSSVGKIGHLFVFDRDADYVTSLLTQLTYEGAIDECFGIKAGVVEFPNSMTDSGHPSKVQLNSKDPVFDSIRNRHFGGVADHLKRKAKDLHEKMLSTTNMSASEMKNFVSNDLRNMQVVQKSLSLHISACEGITSNTRKDFDVQLSTEHGLVTGTATVSEAKKYIEDCIARQLPSTLTLRLLCLYSITQEGLSRKDYESMLSQIVAAHGYHHMHTIFLLRQAGLLLLSGVTEDQNSSSSSKQSQVLRQVVSTLGVKKAGHWNIIAKKLNLIPDTEDIDLHNPTHISYVFNGAYSPLIPYLVSEGISRGLGSLADVVKVLPGISIVSLKEDKSLLSRVVIVLVLGGITFSEVASLRLIAVTLNLKIIIASTCTITGASLIKSVM